VKILKGHAHRINDIAFSSDGRLLVSCGNDNTVRLWDTATGEGSILVQAKGPADSVAFTADSKHVLLRPMWSGLQAWNIADRLCTELIRCGNASYSGGLAVSAKGGLAAASEWIPRPHSYLIRLFNTTTWAETTLYRLRSTGSSIAALCFDSTGTRLVTNVGVFDVGTGKRLLDKPFGGYSLRWSPTAPLVAGTGYRSNAILLQNADTGDHVATLKLERKTVQDFTFSPDGAWVVAVSNEEMVRIWDTQTWKEREGIGKLKCVAFAPDGLRAACGGHRGEILLWDWDL
jgi:WD40 repeat protein